MISSQSLRVAFRPNTPRTRFCMIVAAALSSSSSMGLSIGGSMGISPCNET